VGLLCRYGGVTSSSCVYCIGVDWRTLVIKIVRSYKKLSPKQRGGFLCIIQDSVTWCVVDPGC
jgi:hypothetical protein